MRQKYIGIIRADGKVAYNARFVLGLAAEQLENGKMYTVAELAELATTLNFIKTASDRKDKSSRWRCEIL